MAAPSPLVIALLAAFSVTMLTLALFWPRASSMKTRRRLDELVGGPEAQARHALPVEQSVSLRSEPKKVFKTIVERLRVEPLPEDSPAVQRLRMAGFRGQGPVVTFLAVRILAPFVMFGVSLFYIMVVIQPDAPAPVRILIAASLGMLGWYAPSIYVSNKVQKRQEAVRRVWPDTLDLLLICVESGMGIDSALRRVSKEIGSESKEMAEELEILLAELSYLPERRKAYENLAARTGVDGIKSATTTLMQAEKYGTQIGMSLRVLARESRDQRLSEAEEKAAALPPKLTVPMILFFLPVLFVVIITPAVIQIMRVL